MWSNHQENQEKNVKYLLRVSIFIYLITIFLEVTCTTKLVFPTSQPLADNE